MKDYQRRARQIMQESVHIGNSVSMDPLLRSQVERTHADPPPSTPTGTPRGWRRNVLLGMWDRLRNRASSSSASSREPSPPNPILQNELCTELTNLVVRVGSACFAMDECELRASPGLQSLILTQATRWSDMPDWIKLSGILALRKAIGWVFPPVVRPPDAPLPVVVEEPIVAPPFDFLDAPLPRETPGVEEPVPAEVAHRAAKRPRKTNDNKPDKQRGKRHKTDHSMDVCCDTVASSEEGGALVPPLALPEATEVSEEGQKAGKPRPCRPRRLEKAPKSPKEPSKRKCKKSSLDSLPSHPFDDTAPDDIVVVESVPEPTSSDSSDLITL